MLMRLKRAVVGGEIYIAINNLLARFIRAFLFTRSIYIVYTLCVARVCATKRRIYMHNSVNAMEVLI